MRKLSCAVGLMLAVTAMAQPPLHLKTWKRDGARTETATAAPKTMTPGRSHLLVQFAKEPSTAQLNLLGRRGVSVLSYVPEKALSVAARNGLSFKGLGVQWVGRLQPAEKISPNLNGQLSLVKTTAVVVEFYSDVSNSTARSIANQSGLLILDNPDLLPNHLLLLGTENQLNALAQWDEVSYIFPASQDLVQGSPVHGCAGALTSAGPVAQAIPLVGDGWDGPGLGTASLNYAFVNLTSQVPLDSAEAEIERAYSQWAKVVQVTFTQTNNPTGAQTLAVLFASGAHGDGYPFTAGVLAHTFYPVPVNAEPIAGDQHFNNDETWKIGADVDVFSVALHETGHALGLGHSDNPADVMYPYYHIVTGLAPGDIAAIQELYAANNSENPATPAQPPASLVLTVQPSPTPTSLSSIALSGTASGGTGTIQVSWSTNQGASGAAQGSSNWTIGAIPLSVGANVITVTAVDAIQTRATQSLTVTQQPPSPPSDPVPTPTPSPAPSNPSPGSDTTAPSITVLSPAMVTSSTSASSIVVSGTASDNAGVAQITWASSTGASGMATGTSNWTTPAIPLYLGTTTITIYASDASGNKAWRSLTVTRY
ncbi:MAG TPA: matrixin family metalloprotease [Bryobacteraceae bacterium]